MPTRGLKIGPRWSQELEDRPKMVPKGDGASQIRLRETKILKKPGENQRLSPSRLFACNGLLRPQYGLLRPQDGLLRPQDGPLLGEVLEDS